jgi:hypothetical protein
MRSCCAVLLAVLLAHVAPADAGSVLGIDLGACASQQDAAAKHCALSPMPGARGLCRVVPAPPAIAALRRAPACML